MPKDLSVIFLAHPATQIRVVRPEFTEEYDVHVVSFTLPVALQGDEFPVMQSRLPGSLASLLSPRSPRAPSRRSDPRYVPRRILAATLRVLAVCLPQPFFLVGSCLQLATLFLLLFHAPLPFFGVRGLYIATGQYSSLCVGAVVFYPRR